MSYVSGSESERKEMLNDIGISDFSELISEIPKKYLLNKPLNLPPGKSEYEVVEYMKKLADINKSCAGLLCFLGGGAYDHYIPAAVDTIISRSEFLTAYTPYQAEVSQGTLQGIYEFQSLVCRLTGMDVANASMYDGASAAAEAVLLALTHTGNDRVFLSSGVHPSYREVIETYSSGMNITMDTLPGRDGRVDAHKLDSVDLDSAACVVVQSPGFFGLIEDIKRIGSVLERKKALFIVIANPVSLAFLTSPGEARADLAVGDMQVFGNSLNFGGPYIGYFAANEKYVRKIPGRLVARTKDVDGNAGYVLTLQTREQHIRRDKATSNICTNQALCALAAAVHLSLMGEKGIKDAAEQSVKKAHYLAEKLKGLEGFSLVYDGRFFNEFALRVPFDADEFVALMEEENILAGVPLGKFYPDRKDQILVAVTEKRSKGDLDYYVEKVSRIIKTK